MTDKEDNLPGELARNMTKNADTGAITPTQLEIAPVAPDLFEGNAATIGNATQSLVASHMAPEDLDPSFTDIVGAEFRQNNIVASALSSRLLAERIDPTITSPAMSQADIVKKVEENNLQPYFDYFKGARNEAEFDAIKADLAREQEDKRIQAASGWTGTAVGFGAMVADLPSLLPASIGLKVAAKAPAAMRAALELAAGGAAQATASEVGLQASQVDRSTGQAVANVGSATLLGGILGAGVHSIVGREIGDKVVNKLDEVRTDAANGFPKAQSAGAATAGDVYEQAAQRGLNDDDRLFAAGAFTSLEKLGDIPVIGEWLRNPRLDSERSPSRVVRDIIERLSDTGSITQRNANGIAAQDSAQSAILKFQGQLAQADHDVSAIFAKNKAAYGNDRGAFNERVARALANGEMFDDPSIVAAAKVLRERVFEPIREALVKNNVFTDDPEIKNAIGYFPVVYDAEAIRAQKEDFINFHTDAFSIDIQNETADALRAKGALSSDIEDAVIKNFGVKKQVPKVDEAGNPVINPKTGKQVIETQEVSPGTLGEARKAITDEHAARTEEVNADRTEALARFDKGEQAPQPFTVDNGDQVGPPVVVADHSAAFAERDKVADARINAELHRDDVLKDIEATKQKAFEEAEAAYNRDVINNNMKVTQKIRGARTKAENAAKREAAAAEKEAKAAFTKTQKELDERLKDARDRVQKAYASHEDELRAARDEQIAKATENARDNVIAAKGVDLPEGFETTLRKYVRGGAEARDLIEKEAAQRAEALYRSVTGQDRYTFSHEIGQNGGNGVRGYSKARKNPAYHTDLMDRGWVLKNAMEAAEKYTKAAGADAALGSIFKKTISLGKDDAGKEITEEVGDHLLSDALKKAKADWDNIITNATAPKSVIDKLTKKHKNDPVRLEQELNKARGDAEAKLIKARNRDLNNIELLRNFARGTASSNLPRAVHQAAELFGIFNYVTKMGGQVLSSLGDPINIMLAQGFGNAAKYGLVPLLSEFRGAMLNADGRLRTLSRLAGANMEMEHGSRIAAMADLGNVYSSRDVMATPRRIAETFSKFAGITYWNTFVKQIAYNTSQARLIMNAVEGFDKVNPAERAWMASLGIDAKRAAAIAEEYSKQGQKFEATIPVADWDKWENKEAGEWFRQAVGRESFNSVIAPTMSDRLALSASPLGRMILQFRNFMIANQMRLVGRNIQLASLDKQRAASVYTGLFGLVLASAMIDATKRIVANSDFEGSLSDESQWQKYLDDWKTRPAQQMYNALDRSGHFGVLFEGSNILDKLGLPSIQGAARLATGEEANPNGTSRTKDVSVLGSAFGPTVGLLDDTAHALAVGSNVLGSQLHAFRGNDGEFTPPYEFSRTDWKRVQRVVPGSTHPIVRMIMNEGQRHAGNYFDWPNPQ